jgi:hypothetical protein
VSRICVELGVDMGDDLLGTHPSQPHGHWEDKEFYHLNELILQSCGDNGSWDRPPTVHAVEFVRDGHYSSNAKELVAKKNKNSLWGWKDPRTCLTLPIYWPYLTDVKLLFTKRNRVGTIRSLMSRSGGSCQKWERVIGVYEEGINWAREHGVPQLVVDTDRLVNRSFSKVEIGKIARFLGRPVPLIDKAARVVAFR